MSLLFKIPTVDLSAVTTLLGQVKAKTDNLPATPANETTVAAVKAKTDNLPADPTSETGAIARKFPFMDFWSAAADKITITNVAADLTFPDIVVAALPSGLTIKKVVLVLSARALNNTNAADNYISAAGKTLRVKKSTGAWGVDDVVGITIPNSGLYGKASAKENGPVIIGSADLSALVNANSTYNVRSDQTTRGDALVAAGASLELNDIQVGLRVFYS